MKAYGRFFSLRDYSGIRNYCFFTGNNQDYSDMMFKILQNLEPRNIEYNEIVLDEGDDVEEVTFLINSETCYEVGFRPVKIDPLTVTDP